MDGALQSFWKFPYNPFGYDFMEKTVNLNCDKQLNKVCEATINYIIRNQDFTPGEYYGSFWSEKGYHGPLLDYNAGGSHHHRGTGSAALLLWLVGKARKDKTLLHKSETAFDWLVSRQRSRGGYPEIQNNENEADWEGTGLEELSTIALGFVAHGLANALLAGLPPKKSYMDCLMKACHWQLSIEFPPGSGIFPHHERSSFDTLNANMHAAESLGASFAALMKIYNREIMPFYNGAKRTALHTMECQWPDGCLPYRDYGDSTINYTSLVLWCYLNLADALPENYRNDICNSSELKLMYAKATGFLCKCIDAKGRLRWDKNEMSTARHNVWTYAITYNVLKRIGGKRNESAAAKILAQLICMKTASGLLPMRDRGEEITECLFMQADMMLFLLPFSGVPGCQS